MSNFLISTGGSGGHVLPAIILHEHLAKSANIVIASDKRGLKFIDKNKYDLEIINTPKLGNIYLFPINFFLMIILIFKSIFVLKNRKIKKIISIGGYMSLPLIIAAKLTGLTIYLIEPNQVLGRANKLFLNFCKNIFCYSKNIRNFPKKFENKIIVINPLVKKEIYKLSDSNLKKQKFNLLIVGGSQGASFFDKNLKDVIFDISKNYLIKITQQTNEINIANLTDFYSKNNIENKIFSFNKEFSKVIYQADLCITRAGASTLAELSVLNIPFIAVPLPTSKDNHQFENAMFYKENNCCWILDQDIFEQRIETLLKHILDDKTEYLIKKENLKKMNFQNTWINVNQKLLKTINEN